MEIKSKHALHIEFNNLACIFLARVTEHLSTCRCNISLLTRNGSSLLRVDSPSVFHPNSFLHSIPHTCLTDIIYTISLMLFTKHVVQMRHFQNVQWSFPWNSLAKESTIFGVFGETLVVQVDPVEILTSNRLISLTTNYNWSCKIVNNGDWKWSCNTKLY